MAEGVPPHIRETPMKIMMLIATVPSPTLKPISEDAKKTPWSAEFSHFLKCALHLNPERRSCAAQLLMHPFLRSAATQEQASIFFTFQHQSNK